MIRTLKFAFVALVFAVGLIACHSPGPEAPSGAEFVYRPCTAACTPVQYGPKIYSDWATLVSDMQRVDGAKTLWFDNSLLATPTTAIVLPVGSWDMLNVAWAGRQNAATFRTPVTLPEGCTLRRLRRILGFLNIVSSATSTPNISDFDIVADALAGPSFLVSDGGLYQGPTLLNTSGTAPMFRVNSGGLLIFSNRLAFVTGISGAPVIDVVSGGELRVLARTNAFFDSFSIATAVGSTLVVNSDSPTVNFQPVGIAGTMSTYNINDRARYRMIPRPFLPTTAPSATAIASAVANDFLRLAPPGPTAITQLLPLINPAAGVSGVNQGRSIAIKNTGAVNVLVNPSGADTIDGIVSGAGGASFVAPGNSRVFANDGGSNWVIVSDGHMAGAVAKSGVLSPAALAAGANENYAPTGILGAVWMLRLQGDAGGTSVLGGLTGGYAGRELAACNVGTGAFDLADASAGSSAANRFCLDGDITLAIDTCAQLWYDGTSTCWRALGQAN